jgi:hypothetical protein
MTVSGLKGVGDGGGLAMIGATATFAAESVRMTIVVPVTVTPPLAVPPSTGRDSVTDVVLPPFASSVAISTWDASLFGATVELNLPASAVGMVTTTRFSLRATDEPGINRSTEPSFVPAACPTELTTKAWLASSNVKVSIGSSIGCTADGPVCVTMLCIPSLTSTGGTAVSTPNVRTVPSVVLTIVRPSASMRTRNAVPWTVLVDVEVTTAYLPASPIACPTTCHVLPVTWRRTRSMSPSASARSVSMTTCVSGSRTTSERSKNVRAA